MPQTTARGEAKYCTSSIGQISFLLWENIYPDDLTIEPVACLYFGKQDFGNALSKYWEGYTVPMCEIAECINVANKIVKQKAIKKEWFSELKEAIEELREDYIVPKMF